MSRFYGSLCIGCHKWVHTKCSGIKCSMYKVIRSFIYFIQRHMTHLNFHKYMTISCKPYATET